MTSTIAAGSTTLDGEPDAIRDTGRRWRTAAMSCAAAAAQVSALAVVDGFLGDESTTWEQRLGPQTSDLLSTLATARDIVGGALVAYADVLEDCQRELRALAVHRAEAGVALDRWRDTPTAEPDLVDSATQTVHDLDARSAAVLARHTAAVRACGVQIDRATAMSPGSVAGVRPAVGPVRAGSGPGRFHQSSNAVLAGFALTRPAQLSAVGPFHATGEHSGDTPNDNRDPWINPATRERYYQDLYQYCMGKQSINPDDLAGKGLGLDRACAGYADSALTSPDNLIAAVTLSRGAIAMPPLPKTTFGDVWNDYIDALHDMGTMAEQAGDTLAHFMLGGCMERGSIGACLFDVATAPIPFFKGAKAIKVAVEVVEDGADVIKVGGKAADAEKAADEAAGATGRTAAQVNRFGAFSREQLLAAGAEPRINGLTEAGRGLQKHSSRADSVFNGLSTGTAAERNTQGQRVLSEILDDAVDVQVKDRVINIFDSTGRGVRFTKEGKYMGPLEPNR